MWPDTFKQSVGSRLCNAMDNARGGKFETTPDFVPESAWYTNDDAACDYSCQS